MAAKKRTFSQYLLYIILIPSVLLNIFLLTKPKPPVPTQTPSIGNKVIGVIDGDTLVFDGKTRLRLRHIDAPESEYCGGKEAKEYLEKLVVGKNVRIDEQIPDQYGRGMAMAYVGDTSVNEAMLKSGWVRYHSDVSTKTEKLKKVADEAKKNNLGLFGLCHSKENTQNPKCVIKGNIDKSTDVRKYYVPNCAQYKFTIVEKDIGENWFCTEKEAKAAGYVKADTCK